MKVSLSILAADLRGSAGGVTAGKWKSQNYFRTRVVPANPNTAAQQEQRLAFTICVACWRALTAAMKSSWDTIADARSISGFNAFMSNNVAQERTDSMTMVTPTNSDEAAPNNVTLATGAAPGGSIDITWEQGDATGASQLGIWYRATETSPYTYSEPAGATMADEAYTLEVGAFDQETAVSICAYDATNGFSLAQGGEATSSAEV